MCSSYGQLTGDASVGSDNGQIVFYQFSLGISLSYISVQLTGDASAGFDNGQKIATSLIWDLPLLY